MRIARGSHGEGHDHMAGRAGHRGFGHIRKLPSGRHQASYIGPDLARHAAGATFEAKQDAEAWLAEEHKLIAADAWTPPARRRAAAQIDIVLTFGTFAEDWLAHRTLKPRTRAHYHKLLDIHILPVLGHLEIEVITPAMVRSWYAATAIDSPTLRAHCYALARTIFNGALADRVVAANPCTMRGAGNAKRAGKTEPASLDQLAAIVEAIPARYKLMILLASWCGMRFGELIELRGSDIDTRQGVIKIRRGVVWVDGQSVVGKPKSDAGVRDVTVPPHLVPAVRAHLLEFGVGRDGLLFPSAHDSARHMRPATLYKVYYAAREKAGRPDLRFHDLRHTGAVLAAATGATLAELMARLGHSTPGAALRYQHAARGRDAEIARALSTLANTMPG
jgi:integrase